MVLLATDSLGSCSKVIKMYHKKSSINILLLFLFNMLAALVIWVQLNKKKKILKKVQQQTLIYMLMKFEIRAQFHQCSMRSFCANSLAPVKFKPKT